MYSRHLILILLISFVSFTSNAQPSSPKNDSKVIGSTINTNKVSKTRYYYYPNTQAYFDLKKKVYYYRMNNQWQTAEKLPNNYGGYSLFRNFRVEITDFDGETPYTLIDRHKKLFPYTNTGKYKT